MTRRHERPATLRRVVATGVVLALAAVGVACSSDNTSGQVKLPEGVSDTSTASTELVTTTTTTPGTPYSWELSTADGSHIKVSLTVQAAKPFTQLTDPADATSCRLDGTQLDRYAVLPYTMTVTNLTQVSVDMPFYFRWGYYTNDIREDSPVLMAATYSDGPECVRLDAKTFSTLGFANKIATSGTLQTRGAFVIEDYYTPRSPGGDPAVANLALVRAVASAPSGGTPYRVTNISGEGITRDQWGLVITLR
jgi:hypothetical protein